MKPSDTQGSDFGIGMLIQDEPVLSYRPEHADDPPLAALLSPLPPGDQPVWQELLFDRHRHSFFHFDDGRRPPDEDSAAGKAYVLHTLAEHGGDPRKIKQAELDMVQHAALDPQLQQWCDAHPDTHIADKIRALAAAIVREKGYFGLDTDTQSMLLYDIRFLLASHGQTIHNQEDWLHLQHHPRRGYFNPTDNNDDLARLWLMKRLADGDVVDNGEGLHATPEFAATVQQVLNAYLWD